MARTTRDIYLSVLDMAETERTLKWEFGYWGATLTNWYRDGLPRRVGFDRELLYGEFVNGPALQYPMPSYDDGVQFAHDVSAFFGLDQPPAPFPFNWFYYPRWEREVICGTEDKVEYVGVDGIRRLAFKDERSMPSWLGHPVTCEADWERIKRERLSLDNFAERYTVHDLAAYLAQARRRDTPLCLYGSPIGFFGILRFMIGEENLYYWYYDKPDLITAILEHLCAMWLAIAEELTGLVDFDYGRFYEDMAYKGGSSDQPPDVPKIHDALLSPPDRLRRGRGIKHFVVDSDGLVDDLIPLFGEAGMTALLPFEVRAGNDIEQVRRRYPTPGHPGRHRQDGAAEPAGHRPGVGQVARMIPQGGYIPYVDHAVPPDVSWENFRYYREKLNEIIESVRVCPSG